MKSGLASALTAFAEVAKSQKENAEDIEKLPGTLVFIGTVDEEADMKGSEAAVQQGWIQKEDWVLDMEPTSGMIQMAHKGRTWFELNVEGITAHASMPEKGADAIAGIAFMIAEIRKAMGEVPTHEELGKSTVTFGQISGGYSPYVVSDHSMVTIDMRLVPPMNTQEAEKIVRKAIEIGENAVPGVKGSYKITGDRPPVETHMESGLMKALSESVKKLLEKIRLCQRSRVIQTQQLWQVFWEIRIVCLMGREILHRLINRMSMLKLRILSGVFRFIVS